MTTRRILPGLLAAVIVAIAADSAVAVRPINLLRPYRFLPGRSVLHQTGGFAGVDEKWRVRGTFDLKLEPSAVAVFPPIYSAKFVNVDAWATHPVRDDVLILDEVLNLSGLNGGQVLADPTRTLFQFRGKTADGSSVELHAKTRGPWLYVRGGTMAPEGSADYFEYGIRALAHLRPWADRNEDGVVDRADLTALASDPAYTGADFLEWQRQLGETPPSQDLLDAELDAAIAAAGSSLAAVPEPAAGALALVAGMALLAARRLSQ